MRARVILRNSSWSYLDFVVSFASSLFLSVAVARKLGPDDLGFFNYIIWITYTTQQLVAFGVTTGTRKYVAELLGGGDIREARRVVVRTLRLQLVVAALLLAIAALVVWLVVEPDHWLFTMLAIASVAPALIVGVYSNALMAAERFMPNVQASLAGTVLNCGMVAAFLYLGYGLAGVTASLFVSRMFDLLLRAWAYRVNFPQAAGGDGPSAPVSSALRGRINRFYWQSTVLLIFNLVVWDRSELLFLREFSAIREVAYYSLSFNIASQLLAFSQIFAQAAGATLMVDYGRDRENTGRLAATTVRYVSLLAFPVLMGGVALSGPLMAIYGARYAPAIPVFTLLCAFTIPRALMFAPQQQILSFEKQPFLLKWGAVMAAVNITLDIVFIRRYGALGAALGNGLTQTISSVGIIWYARSLDVRIRWNAIARIGASSLLMLLAVWPLAGALRPFVALLVCPPIGALAYLAGLKLTRALTTEDYSRLALITEKLPGRARRLSGVVLRSLTNRSAEAAV